MHHLNQNWQNLLLFVDYAFQPIVNPLTGCTFAVEALMRNHASSGFESIGDLFNAAFAEGVLFSLDVELRARALKKFLSLPACSSLKLFYNYDQRIHLMENYRIGVTEELLHQTGLSPDMLCYELSERYPIHSIESLKKLLELSRQRGFKIAIDDFGVGYSSIEMLYHSEPDYIKFDRFLIKDIDSDVKKRSFCSHLLNLAQGINVVTVAEGVETLDEYQTCREMGFSLIQGFFIQRPTIEVCEIHKEYRHIVELCEKDKRRSGGDAQILRKTIQRTESVNINDDIMILFEKFHRNSRSSFFPVVDEQCTPLGIIHETSIKSYIYSPFGYDLLRNRSLTPSLRKFVTRCPITDLNLSQERILELFVNNPDSEGIIITENARYLGFLDGKSLLTIINEKNLTYAREINPLTKLPGNCLINRYIIESLEKSEFYFFVYMDFDNFKPFNDRFGFRQGDRMILLFVEMMRSAFTGKETFAGHIGGDDFFLGLAMPADTVAEIAGDVRELMENFAYSAGTLYSDDETKNGCYRARNRNGDDSCFPLLTVSAAILGLKGGNGEVTLNIQEFAPIPEHGPAGHKRFYEKRTS